MESFWIQSAFGFELMESGEKLNDSGFIQFGTRSNQFKSRFIQFKSPSNQFGTRVNQFKSRVIQFKSRVIQFKSRVIQFASGFQSMVVISGWRAGESGRMG
jgi:hypothetical protein